jgi:hypothetical protein
MDSEVIRKKCELSLALLFIVDKHDRDVIFHLIDLTALLARKGVLLRPVIQITLALWTAENIKKFFAEHHTSCRVW